MRVFSRRWEFWREARPSFGRKLIVVASVLTGLSGPRFARHARDAERANRILEKAEKHCLISNSIKTETKLEPEVSFAGE